MASPAGHRRNMQRPTGKNLKKGICENHNYDNPDTGETGDCPKCASREVQTVNVQRLSDFKCDTCGAKLTPFKEPVKPLKIIVFALLAAIVIVFALGWGLGWFTGAKDDVPVDEPVEAVETPDEDDAAAKAAEEQARLEAEEQARLDAEAQAQRDAEEQARIEAEAQVQKEAAAAASNTRTTTPAVQPASSSVLGGAATLVDNGGYKELRFKRSYTLDLGKNSGEVIYLNAGDKIERAQIHNGILRGGNLRKADGEERAVNGLNVKL